mgnify:CR=1 FL=1
MEGSRTRALQYQRFTRLDRALHVTMIVSFISLALTGDIHTPGDGLKQCWGGRQARWQHLPWVAPIA